MANRAHIPKRFAGIITPFPLRKRWNLFLFLFRGDAARRRRATVKSGRRTTTGPPQSCLKSRRSSGSH